MQGSQSLINFRAAMRIRAPYNGSELENELSKYSNISLDKASLKYSVISIKCELFQDEFTQFISTICNYDEPSCLYLKAANKIALDFSGISLDIFVNKLMPRNLKKYNFHYDDKNSGTLICQLIRNYTINEIFSFLKLIGKVK